MIRVKDSNGRIVEGLFRDETGALIVKNDAELDKYLQQKRVVVEQKETINRLSDEIEELKRMVNSLLKKD